MGKEGTWNFLVCHLSEIAPTLLSLCNLLSVGVGSAHNLPGYCSAYRSSMGLLNQSFLLLDYTHTHLLHRQRQVQSELKMAKSHV